MEDSVFEHRIFNFFSLLVSNLAKNVRGRFGCSEESMLQAGRGEASVLRGAEDGPHLYHSQGVLGSLLPSVR